MTPFPTRVRFDEARAIAFELAGAVFGQGVDVLVVRDVLGRFSLLLDDRAEGVAVTEEQYERWHIQWQERLGRYAGDRPVALATQMFAADALLESPRVVPDQGGATAGGGVRFLDNTVVGENWSRVTFPGPEADGSRTHRTALYGFKGGVGRTTATAMLARHLADQGHIVLVVDLDLESPGVGSLLTGGAPLPSYGVADQLVEAALGNDGGLEIVARSGFEPRNQGELWVAPARGAGTDGVHYSYVDKLNRIYADTADADFAQRLENAVRACEDAVERIGDSGRRPDVVLLDSRAGIHDVAAVAISQLSDLALLFGSDNAQTWAGYGDLFASWQLSGQARPIREKLRMVASMVPDSVHHPMERYLESFRSNAYDCFAVLYDDVAADETAEAEAAGQAYSPALTDEAAPHAPIPILFEPGLVGMNAPDSPDWQNRAFVQAAYRDFLATAAQLITASPGDEATAGATDGQSREEEEAR
ncbi:KGGVGR-motif variant AAA ATPase [Streptacidiphilus neutrinimicus]|uniref:KGGVGR-motif variant AAA ATPase n=1 Tax=Streptacidiphilus neutrinimicus TaxID=105420 RepID=UPI000693772C|nr:AAA family ATPase [Streptacidiphilus neutrinimicus]